jgi:hypothetical protein
MKNSKETPKTFKELFANTGIEPTTDESGNTHYNFKATIKKEPKQIYYNTVGRENGEFVIKGQFNTQKEALDLANELYRKFPDLYYDWNETLIKEESKQETTLEEAYNKIYKEIDFSEFDFASFAIGAKWQQEQDKKLYNEEEVYNIVENVIKESKEKQLTFFDGGVYNPIYTNLKKWFEQNKKK